MAEGTSIEHETVDTLMDALLPYSTDIAGVVRQVPSVEMFRLTLGDYPTGAVLSLLFMPANTFESVMLEALMGSPQSMFGFGTPQDASMLVAHASCIGASCSYCTMHTCVVLKRGGVPVERMLPESDAQDCALREFGISLGTIPSKVTKSHINRVSEHYSDEHVERFAMSAASFGYLNTKMDLLGTPLEGSLMQDNADYLDAISYDSSQSRTTATTDSTSDGKVKWYEWLRILPVLPKIILDSFWALRGIPTNIDAANEYLQNRIGGTLSVLRQVKFPGCRSALVVALTANLLAEECVISCAEKYIIGVVFAQRAENDILKGEMLKLLEHASGDIHSCQDLCGILDGSTSCGTDDEWALYTLNRLRSYKKYSEQQVLLFSVALAGCYAPTKSGKILSEAVRDGIQLVTPEAVMEMVTWIGTLSMFNRMSAFYAARDN